MHERPKQAQGEDQRCSERGSCSASSAQLREGLGNEAPAPTPPHVPDEDIEGADLLLQAQHWMAGQSSQEAQL